MSLKGFTGFKNSKVASHKVISHAKPNLNLGKFGKNKSKEGVSFKSGTKAAKGPAC